MLLQDEAVETLVSLGLTVLQAKVYLALATSGKSTGKATAKSAKVASQDIYRVLTELQEIGLIEKIIAKPNQYSPIPLDEGLSALLKCRQEKTVELKKAAAQISKSLQTTDTYRDINEIGDFVLIPKKQLLRAKKAVENAQTSIDLMFDFEAAMTHHIKFFELEIKLLDRGVKIRNLLNKKEHDTCASKEFLELKNKSEFEAKLCFDEITKLIIVDRKELFLSTISKSGISDQPYLWSNNQVLVEIIQQWYEMLWEKSSF